MFLSEFACPPTTLYVPSSFLVTSIWSTAHLPSGSTNLIGLFHIALYGSQAGTFAASGSTLNHLPDLLSYILAPKSKCVPIPAHSLSLSIPLNPTLYLSPPSSQTLTNTSSFTQEPPVYRILPILKCRFPWIPTLTFVKLSAIFKYTASSGFS